MMSALVSAVIPTHHRQELVQRAIRSVLNQTYSNLEIVVVIDGPEPGTAEILASLHEPRLRVIELEKNLGLSGARNAGIEAARGDWVGLLDDDDEWLPEKIEKQLALLSEHAENTNLLGCRMRYSEGFAGQSLPPRFPDAREDLGEYIYCNRNCLYPSTFLIRRQYALHRPFSETLQVNEDCDWLLRGRAEGLLAPKFCEETLVIIHDDIRRPHHDDKSSWRLAHRWITANRGLLLTPRAFSYSLLKLCVLTVRRSESPVRDAFFLMREALFKGKVDLRFLVYFMVYVLFSDENRRELRDLNEKVRLSIWHVLGRSKVALGQ